MKLRLMEIELNTSDPEKAKKFYHHQLGLSIHADEEGLKVFDSGVGVDFDTSVHFPGRISISFYAENIPGCLETLKKRGATVVETYGDPVAAIVLEDPDGHRIEVKSQVG